MKKLTVYECPHCKKLFRTPNRHDCKYDPEYKNCYTCKHNLGFKVEQEEQSYGSRAMLTVDCDIEHDWITAKWLSDEGYILNCSEYDHCKHYYLYQLEKNDHEAREKTDNPFEL